MNFLRNMFIRFANYGSALAILSLQEAAWSEATMQGGQLKLAGPAWSASVMQGLGQSPKTGELAAFFANISFLLLFGAMFFYWINLIFSKKTPLRVRGPALSGVEGPTKQDQSGGLTNTNNQSLPPAWSVATMQPQPQTTLKNAVMTKDTADVLATYVPTKSDTYSPCIVGPTAWSWSSIASLGDRGATRQPNHARTASSGPKMQGPNIANIFILFANISLFLLLCIRWQESGHFPLSNLYESLIFLSWSCTTAQLSLLWYYSPVLPIEKLAGPCILADVASTSERAEDAGPSPTYQVRRRPYRGDMLISELLGSVLAPCALFLNAFATFSLPKEMQQAGPLVPALQSNWLMMHVTVMIISYAALMVGSLLAIAYLILARVRSASGKQPNEPAWCRGALAPRGSSTSSTVTNLNKKKIQSVIKISTTSNTISDNLDYLSYRIIGIGFPFLTIGILSGAVWANEAWGSYWSWDPKETWALLTWFVFAIYLHTRLTKGWEGERPAILASFGFIVVWICYLGVNLLGEGLHSYGFFKG